MTIIPRRRLGTDGPEVSRLCLGTMMFGDRTGEAEATEIVDAYAEAGGNFLDTADVYADGASERIVGRAIEGRRDDFLIATKVGNVMPSVAGSGGISERWIARALDASLDRLGVDAIDLYYLHRDDDETPLDEAIAALGQAMTDGKVHAWGFSNFRGWKIAEMVHIADRLGVPRPIAMQPYYHALYRVAEIELLPACEHFGIGVVSYSPLARGVLTGKYADGVPEGSRAASGDVRITETEMRPELLNAARRFEAHAQRTGRRTADVALQWVLASDLVTSTLAGPRTLEQLRSYLEGLGAEHREEDEAAVSAIVPPGGTAGAGYADPRYPYRGRLTRFGREGATG